MKIPFSDNRVNLITSLAVPIRWKMQTFQSKVMGHGAAECYTCFTLRFIHCMYVERNMVSRHQICYMHL